MKLRKSRGFALSQLVVSIILGAFILAAVAFALLSLLRTTEANNRQGEAISSVQNTINRFTKDVDSASSIVYGTTNDLVVQLVRDGACVGVRYAAITSGETRNVVYQEHRSSQTTCANNPIASYTWPALNNPANINQVLVRDIKTTDIFRYYGNTGGTLAPPLSLTGAGNASTGAIARAEILVSALSYSKSDITMVGSGIPPTFTNSNIGGFTVAGPSCPAPSVDEEVSSGVVTGARVTWSPTYATAYRITRVLVGPTGTTSSSITINATTGAYVTGTNLTPSGLPPFALSPTTSERWSGSETPFFLDKNFADSRGVGHVFSYVVDALKDGEWSTACMSAQIRSEVSPPGGTDRVTITADRSAWTGNRTANQITSGAGRPSFTFAWGDGSSYTSPVPGAKGYIAQYIEVNPSTGAEIGAWTDMPGASDMRTNRNRTSATLTSVGGASLFGREFKFRVQYLSATGASRYQYFHTTASGAARTETQGAANRGYIAPPAAPRVVVSSSGNGSASVKWSKDPSAPAVTRRDIVRISQVQGANRDGVTGNTVSWGSFADIDKKTTLSVAAPSGTVNRTSLAAGDISDYRARLCNNSPFPLKYADNEAACGPYSVRQSALQKPSTPKISASVNTSTRTNTIKWGKNTDLNPGSNFLNQRVNHYDGQSQDTATSNKWKNTWAKVIGLTKTQKNKYAGDWARYRVRACNTLSGLKNTTGGGCSSYTSSTSKMWQKPANPTCRVTGVTWRSISASNVRSTKRGAAGYVNPDSTVKVQIRFVSSDVRKDVVTQSKGSTATVGATFTDLSPSSLTIKPRTRYSIDTRIWNTAGWSDWGSNCAGTTSSPPIPVAPSISSSKNNSSRTITWSWTRPTNANLFYATGAFTATTTNTSQTLTGQPYGVQRCERVRAAYNSRLASWGYWGGWSNTSCQTLVNPVPPAPPVPASSPQCGPYLAAGKVITALDRLAGNGFGVTWRHKGSSAADSGVYMSGEPGTSTLTCTFYRNDEYYVPITSTWEPHRNAAIVSPLGRGGNTGV